MKLIIRIIKGLAAFIIGMVAGILIPFKLAWECFKEDEWPWDYA